ncbi:sensor histidine kinase [Kitasatospora phosalacinea]|uniref:Two-component sensor histidine kinase n=1 Tax=Kitasatospora phosalacinea TaxID=2065 RepID=A0A9W6UQ08_9ACTN|nr:sensor histidine kinase [Kitasatospora phosalacinea]GLW56579.1 two-component sensor histidine kinase [Kitasatospora phosalacinea]
MRQPLSRAVDPDAGWLTVVMRLAFLLLLGTSLARYLAHHLASPLTPWVVGLSLALAVGHLSGLSERRPAWLAAVLASWAVLVLMAPSFAWCAVPLVYTVLRALPPRAAIPLVTALTVLVVVSELRLPGGFDPTMLLLPPAVAALATAVFLHMQRQGARQRKLIVDLVRTRRELAAVERRQGALAERERLSVEIHDTLAQGLSSQQMLLQAAERTWRQDPAAALDHVRTAAAIAARNLAEARRFVHDLAPADLAEQGTLEAALQALADREAAESGLAVRFHLDGRAAPMPAAAQSALLRIAQGALANTREHAGAEHASITLSYLGDQAVLDVADDGRGFAPALVGRLGRDERTDWAAGGSRGHGLPAMRARLRQLGGTLTIESAPGEGTVVSAAIPLAGR